MPITFHIDVPLGVVFCKASGAVAHGDFLEFRSRLRAHPDFRPSMKQLFDLLDVRRWDVSTAEIQEMATARTFDATSRRAFVANKDYIFGLSRMIQSQRDPSSEKGFTVCRDMSEALAWLSLSAAPRAGLVPEPNPSTDPTASGGAPGAGHPPSPLT